MRAVWEKVLKGNPSWLMATFTLHAQQQYQRRGRPPKKGAAPDQTVWFLIPILAADQAEVAALASKQTAFIVATNILDA